jgi:hypothetical protein
VSVPDEAIYRCIEPLCAKTLPRRVNYCPYCGTAQHAGVTPQPVAISPERDHLAVASPGTDFGHSAGSQRPVPLQADHATVPLTPPHVVPAQAGTTPSGSSPHTEVEQIAAPAPTVSAPAPKAPISPDWGHTAAPPGPDRGTSAPNAAPTFAKTPIPPARAATASRPPQRQPIRLRWWLLALAALWVVWYMAKPSTKKIDARIDRAIALATECKPNDAQSELIALRKSRATPGQLQRLQEALNSAAADCKRQRKRGRAWTDAGETASPLTGAANGVARPHSNAGRQGTSRTHPRANGEP